MKKLVTILAVLLLVLGWYQTANAVLFASSKYEEHIKAAEAYEKKEIFEDALAEYLAASELKPESADTKLKIAEMQLKLNNRTDFVTICEGLIYQKTINEEALKMLTDYYNSSGKQEEIISMLKELRKEQEENLEVQALWAEYQGAYEELYYSYEELGPFYGTTAVVGNEGKYGLINTQGENVLPVNYDAVSVFSAEVPVAAVSESGIWFYTNEKGHKKIVPDETYDFLGIISEDTVVLSKNQKFGYADTKLQLKTECKWDSASNLYYGVAAVEKNGKWALLGSDLKEKTDYIYEDILVDEAGFCSGQKRIFAKQKDGCHLLDTEGNAVGNLVFEDAKPFGEDEMTAVCIKGKWGFINVEGELVIPCEYEDARTFAFGLAPVKKDGVWGYVDSAGNSVIKPQFEDAYPFNQDGTAPVKEKNWLLIRLYALQ